MGNSNFTVSGQVVLDTADATSGAKAVRTELDVMANTGAARFSELRTNVGKLTADLVGMRKELASTADPSTVAALNSAIAKTKDQLSLARTELKGMSIAGREANETLGLLTSQLGLQLPAGIDKLITRSPILQSALASAFNAGLVVAVGSAIISLLNPADEWLDKLRGIEAASAGVFAEVAKVNSELGGFGKQGTAAALRSQIAAVGADIYQVQGQLDKLTKNPEGTPAAGETNWVMKYFNRGEIALLEEQLKHLQQTQEGLSTSIRSTQTEEYARAVKDATDAANKAAEATLKWRQEQEGLRLAFAGNAMDALKKMNAGAAAALQDDITAANSAVNSAGLADVKKWAVDDLKVHTDVAAGIVALDKQTADAHGKSLTGISRAEFEAQAEIEKINQQGQELLIQDALQGGARREDIERSTAAAIGAVQAEEVRKVADQVDSFINNVFLTARSLTDVFHQLLMQTLSSFVKWVSNMVAQSIIGMKGVMPGGSGGGGILSSLFGSVFGLSPGQGGATASMSAVGVGASGLASGVAGWMPDGGFSGALDAGAITNFSALGGGLAGASGGATSGLLGALAFNKAGLAGLTSEALAMAPLAGVMGGVDLLGVAGSQGGVVKGAAGAGMLAAGGVGIAGMIGGSAAGIGLMGGLAAAFTNPITALIVGGALGIGALVGMLGRDRAKNKASETERIYEYSADDLYKQFQDFKIDHDSAVSGMQALIDQGVQAEGTGKYGRAGAENLTSVINAEIKAVNDLEQQREARQGTMTGMTLPEFAVGGLVGAPAAFGDGMLAVVHPGEFVMRQRAVDALGTDFLQALNRAPTFATGGEVSPSGWLAGVGFGREQRAPDVNVTLNVSAIDRKGVAEWYKDNQRELCTAITRAVRDGAL